MDLRSGTVGSDDLLESVDGTVGEGREGGLHSDLDGLEL